MVRANKDYIFIVKEKRLVDNTLDTLYEKCIITRDIKTMLTPDGASLVLLYCVQKINKALADDLPNHRTVISQVVSSTYRTAKYLVDFISPIIKMNIRLKIHLSLRPCLISKIIIDCIDHIDLK